MQTSFKLHTNVSLSRKRPVVQTPRFILSTIVTFDFPTGNEEQGQMKFARTTLVLTLMFFKKMSKPQHNILSLQHSQMQFPLVARSLTGAPGHPPPPLAGSARVCPLLLMPLLASVASSFCNVVVRSLPLVVAG